MPARLTITREGSGVEGVDVFFQNADNSLVAKVPTDVNGVAEAIVMPGAFVTVVNPFLVATGVRQDELETIAGVQPGDQLTLSEDFGRQTLTSVNVVVDLDPDASQYKIWSTCLPMDGSSAPWYLAVGSGGERPQGSPDFVNCGTKADVLVESENGSLGVGWLFEDDAAVAQGADIDITGPYAATPTVDVSYTDMPAAVSSLNVTNILATSDGPLWRESGSASVGGGAASWSFERPNPAGSTQVFMTDLFGGSSYGQNMVIDWKPIADPATMSFADTLLRQYTGRPSFDPATSSVVWAEDANGAIADLAVTDVSLFREDQTSSQAWRWRLAGVPTGATLKFPVLPTDIAQFNAVAGDDAIVFGLTTAKVPGGYDAVRPGVLSVEDPTDLVVGPAGRIVMQLYAERMVRRAPRAPNATVPFAPLRSR